MRKEKMDDLLKEMQTSLIELNDKIAAAQEELSLDHYQLTLEEIVLLSENIGRKENN